MNDYTSFDEPEMFKLSSIDPQEFIGQEDDIPEDDSALKIGDLDSCEYLPIDHEVYKDSLLLLHSIDFEQDSIAPIEDSDLFQTRKTSEQITPHPTYGESGSLDTEDVPSQPSNPEGGNRRGRPKENKNLSPASLHLFITSELKKHMLKIEKEINGKSDFNTSLNSLLNLLSVSNNLTLESPEEDRKRDDKPRTKIIRLIKKIPSIILKKLVSVGDYKQTNVEKLLRAYTKAFEGLKNSSEYINLHQLFSRQIESLSIGTNVLMFSSINFPSKKVKSVAKYLSASNELTNKLLSGREGTSVKQLRIQIQKNYMIKDLIIFAYACLESSSEFPRSLRILGELLSIQL